MDRIRNKYKNIIFDFGNVLASFDEWKILSRFCEPQDLTLLHECIYEEWWEYDAHVYSQEEYELRVLSKAPVYLHKAIQQYFREWYRLLEPIEEVWELVHELKKEGYRLYILSNAPIVFADHALETYPIVTCFDAAVYSALIRKAKPHHEMYKYLFQTYHLKPEECLFIDDKKVNVEASRELRMDAIEFLGDVQILRNILLPVDI